MKRHIKLMLIGTLVLCGCATDKPDNDHSAIKQQLKEQEARWNQAYAKRDGAALAGMYADDAAIANPGEDLVRGRQAIDQATAGFASDPNMKVAFSANRIQVAQSGDLAYTRGRYTLTMTNAAGQPEMSTGHYLTVWKKQADGSWKAVEDFITPGKPQIAQGATAIL